MNTVYFVIGATAAGKTYFIEHKFKDKDADFFNIYDYQQKVYDSKGYGDRIPLPEQFNCLYKANNLLLNDIMKSLARGRDVIVEQTFYKAKRRIAYIDEIKKEYDNVALEVYLITPGDDQWKSNYEKRQLGSITDFENIRDQIEFPNPAEGFDNIYTVTDDGIFLKMENPQPEIVETARKELAEESRRINEETERREKRRALLDSMNTRPFWHYCEVCGKKEYITAQEANDKGWNYPPIIGVFGVISPRTCGQCSITDTLFWRVNQCKKISIPLIMPSMLKPDELVTWMRIKKEPESLLKEEIKDN